AQGARAVTKKCEYRDGHGGIRNVIEVGVYRFQLAAAHCAVACGCRDPVVAHLDFRAHVAQHIRKPDVALYARAAYAFDTNRAAAREPADRTGRQEVRGRRRVAFDENLAGTAVTGRCRYRERRPAIALNLNTETAHRVERDADIRFGNELTF